MTDIIDSTNLGRLVSDIKAKADSSYWPKDQTTEVNLATVATTGSFNDLTDRPTAAGGALIYLGTCSTAAGTAAKEVTVETFPLQNGKPVVGTVIGVKFDNTNSAANVTLNVNSTGAASIYYTAAVYTSTSSIVSGAKNRYVYYVWDGTYWVWVSQGVDADTNTIAYTVRTSALRKTVTDACGRYRIIFSSVDGTQWVPPTTSTSTNATSSRAVNTRKIDPFGPIMYYATTSVLSAGDAPSASYLQQQAAAITLGYSFNTTGAALVLTEQAPVYIKCAPQSDGSAIIDDTNPYVQAMPTTNDGKIYIYLGVATSTTQIEMVFQHPIYYHDGTGIRVWTGKEIPAISTNIDADKASDAKTVSPKAVYSYVGNPIVSLAVPSTPDGTVIATHLNGDTDTINLNHTHPQYYSKAVETSIPSGGMLPDVAYLLGTLTGSQTFTFAAAVSGNLNHYYFIFTSGSTPVVPTWPVSITKWSGDCVDSDTGLPVLAASKTYEVSVLSGDAFIKEW